MKPEMSAFCCPLFNIIQPESFRVMQSRLMVSKSDYWSISIRSINAEYSFQNSGHESLSHGVKQVQSSWNNIWTVDSLHLQVYRTRRAESRSWPSTPTRCAASTCWPPTSTSPNWRLRPRTTAAPSWRVWSGPPSPRPWTGTSRSVSCATYSVSLKKRSYGCMCENLQSDFQRGWSEISKSTVHMNLEWSDQHVQQTLNQIYAKFYENSRSSGLSQSFWIMIGINRYFFFGMMFISERTGLDHHLPIDLLTWSLLNLIDLSDSDQLRPQLVFFPMILIRQGSFMLQHTSRVQIEAVYSCYLKSAGLFSCNRS